MDEGSGILSSQGAQNSLSSCKLDMKMTQHLAHDWLELLDQTQKHKPRLELCLQVCDGLTVRVNRCWLSH